jgi:hypothetical protein
MPTTKNGSKKSSRSNEIVPAGPGLTMEEGKALIEMMTVGVSETTLAESMDGWTDAKKAEGWQLVAEYFRSVADFNPDLEFGKSIARLNMLFQNSATIQDFKACLSIQKELNKLLSLYAK